MPSLPNPHKGILLTGTQPRCGKTVACAGIVGTLGQLGFRMQAIKPLEFLPPVAVRKAHEQAFFDRLIPPQEHLELLAAESAHRVDHLLWERYLEACRKRVYPYLLETPGSVASPIRFVQDEVLDSIDLSQALQIPLLIVAPKQTDLIAAMAPIFAYVWHRDANVIGWLTVETQPTLAPDQERDILYLNHHYRFPYLGEIAYSPSISVEALQQGNLLRTTEAGLDLLPLQQALNLLVP